MPEPGQGTRPFVGRDRELSELTVALDAIQRGNSQVVLLRGEPGIGKSRLCEEVSSLASQRGFRTAAGRCWETPGAPPYWPWLQLLEELQLDDSELTALLDGSDSTLPREMRRFRVSQLMPRALKAIAKTPIVAVFEDLHAADAPSLELLRVAIRSTRQAPMLWLLTARQRDPRLTGEIATALSGLAREGITLTPSPLGVDDVATWATKTLGRALPPEVLTRVASSSEGTPLFVEGTLRLLSTRSATDAVISWPLPTGAYDVLRDRLAQLPSSALEPLELAAVIGHTFSLKLLGAAVGDSASSVSTKLTPAVEGGVLLERSTDTLAFSHALLREALYETLGAGRRAELHWRVLGALRTAVTPLEELAHHSLAALPHSDEGETVDLVLRAAASAESMSAWHRAIELYQRALAGIDVQRVTPRRADLRLALAHALTQAGHSLRAIEAAESAAADARALSDSERLARAALASGAVFRLGRVDAALVRLLEEALVAIGASQPQLAVVLRARLASALQPVEQPEIPIRLALEAITAARAHPPATLKSALYFGLSAMGDLTDSSQREPLLRELVELCAQSGDRVAEHRARARLAITFFESGKFDEAASCVMTLDRLSRELGPAWRVYPLLFRSMQALLEGRFDDAAEFERHVTRAVELAGDGDHAFSMQMHHLYRCAAMGRNDELLARLEPLRAMLRGSPLEEQGADRVLIGFLAATAGDLDRARVAFQSIPVHAFTYPDRGILFCAAMTAGMLGDAARAEILEKSLSTIHQPFGSQGLMAVAIDGPFSWPRGWLAKARGDLDRAHREFTSAIEDAERVGAKTLVARIVRDRALLGRTSAPLHATPARTATSLRRVEDTWVLSANGHELRFKDSRGFQMLAMLVERPGQSLSCLELSGSDASAEGDAGEILDAKARSEYRQRVEELRTELDEAEQFNDSTRVARLQEELEFLTQELSAAVGLGGRARKAASNAERARSNVQRRLKDALKRIEEASPTVGRRLSRSVTTGSSCRFEELE